MPLDRLIPLGYVLWPGMHAVEIYCDGIYMATLIANALFEAVALSVLDPTHIDEAAVLVAGQLNICFRREGRLLRHSKDHQGYKNRTLQTALHSVTFPQLI